MRALVNRGNVRENDFYDFRARREPRHPSPVIRSIHVHYGHLFEHPSEYFGAIYLASLAREEGITIPRGVQECADAIERERKRGQENA